MVNEATDLAELIDNAAFRKLRNYVEAERERFTLALAARQMDGNKVGDDELNFHRGFYLGALMAVRRPDVALGNLDKAAKIAWAHAASGEALPTEGGDAPYE